MTADEHGGRMRRRASLHEALREVESGALTDVSRIVVSRRWWDALPAAMQEGYRRRCEPHRIELRADGAISRHYVEVVGASDGPPLSTERSI